MQQWSVSLTDHAKIDFSMLSAKLLIHRMSNPTYAQNQLDEHEAVANIDKAMVCITTSFLTPLCAFTAACLSSKK